MKPPRKPTLLLDADVLCHQMAYGSTTKIDWDDTGEAVECLRPAQMLVRIESHIAALVERFKAASVVIALSDRGSNFRKQLWAGYKATRLPKPTLWEDARAFLEGGTLGHQVVSYPRLEGDDVIGILHTGEYAGRSIMVSIDKDMRTIPGHLFLMHRPDEGVHHITEQSANRFHLLQAISGDTTDEYKGAPTFGEARAAAWLDQPELIEWFGGDLWKSVLSAFEGRGLTADDALLNARLARILRHGEYNMTTNKVKLWTPQ